MKVAVLGVGLIGGSIGLAARKRLDADVSGFDPNRSVVEKAREREAISSAAASVEEACEEAELVFCAAPIGALPALVAAALAATGETTVVTDVGSTKRELVAGLADEPRFVGGHPLAGAETAGVENARADIFEGAGWYLTPTERTEGMLYERLQRAIRELGARPQAIDAEAHDRVMATISHLPHVLANVLATQAAERLGASPDRLGEVGPSLRDTTRVAGANPAIWGEILSTNREAVAGEVDAIVERLQEASRLLRGGDAGKVSAWQEEARGHRRQLLETEAEGGPLLELRVRVPNRPGVLAELALAFGDAGVNIEDMTLYPAADMRSGVITIWVAGDDQRKRAERLIGALGDDFSPISL